MARPIRLHANNPPEPTPSLIKWDTLAPPLDPLGQYRIARVPGNQKMHGVILSKKPIGCTTHYFARRTTPCIPDRCPACASGNKPRWYGYLQIYSPSTRNSSILELPHSTIYRLQTTYGDLATWRGYTIKLERVPAKANGRVHAVLIDTQLDHPELPRAVDVTKVLAHIWEQAIRPNDTHESQRGDQ